MRYYENGIIPPIGTPTRKYSLPMMPDMAQVNKDIAKIDEVVKVASSVLGVDPAKPGTDKTEFMTLDMTKLPPITDWIKAWDNQLPKPVAKNEKEPGNFDILDHPYIGGKFTLFVLGFGDNLEILERCIDSIINTCPRHRYDLRVALNQPSPRVMNYVQKLGDIVTEIYPDFKDRKKYPAMREMFHDPCRPIETPYLCWFDDDSWCRKKDWMVLLAQSIIANHSHQGRLYGAWMFHELLANTREGALRERWFQAATWWKGKPLYTGSGKRLAPNGSQIVFASGGFWALSTEVMQKAGIPDERLNHNGGDITIGCQVTQAGYKVVDFSPRPRKEIIAWSDAPRRGYREGFPWS